MTFKEFLQLEVESGVSISQMNPNDQGARAVNKELQGSMPTSVQRQTGQSSVARALNKMLGQKAPLPATQAGPSLKSSLDQKPKSFKAEPKFKQVKYPLGVLSQLQQQPSGN